VRAETSASTLRRNASAMLAATRARLLIISRYPGQLFTDILVPIVLAAMPILLGRSTGGDAAAQTFAQNTGTTNYVGYMMIGSSVFGIVSMSFWHIANWLRWEMETGTIESLYMTPTNRPWIAGGTGIYSVSRSVISALISYIAGSWIFGENPFQGEMLLAFGFVLVGLLPLFGMTLLFGALVIKLKQANAIINLMQWGINFVMGVYFPITVLPPLLRFFSFIFPPTWMTNGVRSALLGVGFFFGEWYQDMAVLWVFMVLAPLFGIWVFQKIETGIRRSEGVGKF